MASTAKNIVLIGAPGAGKGTHAQQLVKDYSWVHISTGDILRANLKANTELGLKAQSYMNTGKLVPDELIIDIMEDRLLKPDCNNGIILDGFPRTIQQAKSLDQLLVRIGKK